MKIHHSKVHGESIAGISVDCKYCDTTVRRPERSIERNDNTFCTQRCKNNWQKSISVEEQPHYQGGGVSVDCHFCGERDTKTVTKKRAREQDRFFCDFDCLGKFNERRYSGEGNPNYKGGDWEHNYRGPNWAIVRNSVRERDNYTCQNCGSTKDELGQIPDCHHIIPEHTFDDRTDAHYEENLILLCRDCHNTFDNMSEDKQRERLKWYPDNS